MANSAKKSLEPSTINGPTRGITPKTIEEWCAQLPISDLSATAKAMYLNLKNIHATDLTPKMRFEILSLLRPTVGYLCQSLQKSYITHEILTENQRLIADLVYILRYEMLKGYKIIINATLNSYWWNKNLLLASFQNAMLYNAKSLFQAYEQHRAPYPGSWLEFHTLFSLAQKKRLLLKPLPPSVEWNCHLNSLQEIYNYCLLFTLSDPHRMRREELVHLTYALEKWAPLLILKKSEHKNSPLFIVDLEKDAPPHYAKFSPSSSANYSIVLDKINERLTRLLNYKKSNDKISLKKFYSEAELQLSIDFISSLISAWKDMSERIHHRSKACGYLKVCLGIAASHWFIRKSDPREVVKKGPSSKITRVIHTGSSLQKDSEASTVSFQSYNCEWIDRSEGGYCLKWLQDIPSQLQCGEIIALEENPAEGQKVWIIGTIRWLRHEKDNSIYLGMQILSTEALAVIARISDALKGHGIPTLLLLDKNKKPSSLIAPTLPFKQGQEIELEYNEKVYSCVLQKSTLLSPNYQAFELDFPFHTLPFSGREENLPFVSFED